MTWLRIKVCENLELKLRIIDSVLSIHLLAFVLIVSGVILYGLINFMQANWESLAELLSINLIANVI